VFARGLWDGVPATFQFRFKFSISTTFLLLQRRVLVLLDDELRKDQVATLNKVLAFAGLQQPSIPLPLLSVGAIEQRYEQAEPRNPLGRSCSSLTMH
jgi:hypothetical protein